jgi:tetratricopeptide (TPR) repeat protein
MKKMVAICLGIMLLSSLVYAEGGAVKQYQKIIETNPNDAEAYYNIGIVYYGEKKYDESKAQFQKAIEIYPDFAEAYYSLGVVHYAEANYDKAVEAFLKAIQIDPRNYEAIYQLGVVYGIKKDKIQAVAQVDKLKELSRNELARKLENLIKK